jgi:hypothetical protein
VSVLNDGGRAGGGNRLSLVGTVCALAVDETLPAAVRSLCWAITRSLATSVDGRGALQRLSFAQTVVLALHKALRAEADDTTLSGALEFLTNWTFGADGVVSLLRAAPTVLVALEDVLVGATHAEGRRILLARTLAGGHGGAARRHELASAVALTLRNLAAHAEGRAHVLASERAVPGLLASLVAPDRTGRLAAHASAALLALVSHSGPKAVLKRGPLVQALIDSEELLRSLATDAATVGAGGRANLRERARRPFVDDAIENLSATRALIAA